MRIHLNYFTYGLIVSALIIISGRVEASNYYVDKDAGGSNNGSSWTNAWESFSDINWSVIGPGDIVYISGGPSGKTYTSGLSIGASGTSGSPVTITKGIDANHNGNVILSGSGGTGIILNNHHDVVISNLMLNGWGTAVSLDGGTSNATYNIVLDNLDGEMAGRYVHIEGYPDVTGSYCHDITIRNCDVTTVTDVNDQTDFIYAQYMKGLIIEDNHVVISNENPSPHCDAIQTYYVDGPVIVRNNYFEHADHKTRNSQGIFFENHEGDYYVYNNIVVMPNSLDGKIYWKSSSVNNAHTYIYSNTIYGLSGNLIETTDPNAVIKNNILYSTGYQSNGSTYMLIFNGVSGNNAQVSNNLFYDPAGNMNNMNSGSNQNGVDGNPIFTNINGRDFTVQSGSPAIDMGANLGNSYNVDMVGTSRPQGQSYDAGAYEKVTGGGGNIPPNQPSNPSPANGAQNQGINTTLSWSCIDPDGDPLNYDVYFGTANNPPLVVSSQTGTNFTPSLLNNNTTYYWKITASDGRGGTSTSPVWSLSTEDNGGTGGDTTPPELVSAVLLDSVNLKLTFSEPLESASAQNSGNYSISNNINVVSASLADSIVFLTTLPHIAGSYSVTVVNVQDLSGNQIVPPNNSADYEYAANTNYINASIKVYIEGPFTDETMSTALAENSLIPSEQPYNRTPWNYNGSEQVSSFSGSIVDWILVELRSETSSSSVVARRAALLRNDGVVMDLNGQDKVSFPDVPNGQYYIVVYHRNHLAIMSRDKVLLSDSSPLYNFTISEDQTYGNQPMKSLGNGKYGLYAADGNSNGNINNADYVGVWKKENGSVGYEDGDFDLNGGVNIVDRNSFWNPNKGKSSQVP